MKGETKKTHIKTSIWENGVIDVSLLDAVQMQPIERLHIPNGKTVAKGGFHSGQEHSGLSPDALN